MKTHHLQAQKIMTKITRFRFRRDKMGTKIPLDKDVFKEMNNKKAWALGLLTADGSFNKARPYEFTIYSTDYSMLKYFRKVFGTKKKIYDHKTERLGDKKVGRLILSSPEIIKDLKRLNAHGTKEERNPFPLVPDKYKWSFVKGLYDGDGNFYKGSISIAGKKKLIKYVYYWICQRINKYPNKIYQSSSSDKTYYFQISKTDAEKVLKLMDKNTGGTYNSPKYKKWKEYHMKVEKGA